jgi:hypothetical protein
MNMTNENSTMVASNASRERYKIQRFPSGWHGYCGKTRVKDFSGSKADAEAWLEKMSGKRSELAAAETREGAIEALFDVTFGRTKFDEDKHELIFDRHSDMWCIYKRKPRFTKIVNDLPKYGSGTITSAYLLEDGCVVGYCKDTKEWLKWNSKGQLNTSCGWSREDAAMLSTDDAGSWCDLDPENGKIIANARTKPTHSERVRAIVTRRDARRAKSRSQRWRELQNPEAHEVATAGLTQAEPPPVRGGIEILDGIDQNFQTRYMNVTAITDAGSYIATQHWCASNDDIAALEKRILKWNDDAVIVRVFMFDTFTKVLHEMIVADGKLARVKPMKEVLS